MITTDTYCENCAADPCVCDLPDCLDREQYEPITCKGPVEYRMPLSGTGRSFPRCEKHWSERLDVQEQINERYPDSPFPPDDFDPTYAGESWDHEDF